MTEPTEPRYRIPLERLDPFQYYYEAEREERLQRVRRSSTWMKDAEGIVCGLPAGWEGTAFTIARYISINLADPPETPPWSSLILRLIRHNVIVKTPFSQMIPGSKRLTPLYRRSEG